MSVSNEPTILRVHDQYILNTYTEPARTITDTLEGHIAHILQEQQRNYTLRDGLPHTT